MRLILAPMEGLTDPPARRLLTATGAFERAVCEFVRVSRGLLPPHVWYRLCPELLTGGRTDSGTPVYVQIMGPEPAVTADNAAFVASLGAPGIDLNFGCPSKTVNRRAAGASLLRTPDRIAAIVAATRNAVPDHIPVTAKVRLGYEDTSQHLEIALAARDGGADELVVHARTRADSYRPPARWPLLDGIRQAVDIPVIANGEIWTPQDWRECARVSGCEAAMLGRGAIARPDLALRLKTGAPPWPWEQVCTLLLHYDSLLGSQDGCVPAIRGGRLKQWLTFIARHACHDWPQARPLFERIRPERDITTIRAMLEDRELAQSAP
ncbi:tRNA dihydrouridine(16) synthase DusC [Haematospirillum jordaniae]|uniref:tRNA dihydrouridine synthase n=1 Tax=Haematospirillum jordaniae TaxID=1549855 RepID=UPI001432BBFC|nr:tRNA-dihydrouridine synthase [Haematospirillum jordaniae]NKD85311.1 tRNA dihydrouridine(16) synthase DusC [Haematospirillum jordaniae]